MSMIPYPILARSSRADQELREYARAELGGSEAVLLGGHQTRRSRRRPSRRRRTVAWLSHGLAAILPRVR